MTCRELSLKLAGFTMAVQKLDGTTCTSFHRTVGTGNVWVLFLRKLKYLSIAMTAAQDRKEHVPLAPTPSAFRQLPVSGSLTPRISKGHLKKQVGFGTASFAGQEQDRACHPVGTQQGGSLQSTFLGFWESTALIRPAPHSGDLHGEENSAHGCASAARCYRDSSGQWGWCPFD